MNRKELLNGKAGMPIPYRGESMSKAIIDFAKKYDLMKHKFMDVYNTYKRSFIEYIKIN